MSKPVKRIAIIVLGVLLLIVANMLLTAVSKSKPIDFVAQYVSVGYHTEEEYGKTVVIRDKAELYTYYTSRTTYTRTPYMPQETKKYDNAFFENHILVIIPLSAGSGGDRFVVNRVTKTNKGLSIGVHQTQHGMTSDIVGWHILLELDRSYDTDAENILVNLP